MLQIKQEPNNNSMTENGVEKEEAEYLERLLPDPDSNRDKILHTVRMLFQMRQQLSPVTRDLLNDASEKVLPEDLKVVLKKYSLSTYYSLLAANSLLSIEDVREDVSEDDSILETTLHARDFRKLRRELDTLPAGDEICSQLAIPLQNICSIRQVDGMEVRELPLRLVVDSPTARRYAFGTPSLTNFNKKTILMMGETGSGKTTLLNSMMNYIMGVQWNCPYRYQLIPDDVIGTQAESQTKKVTAYEIHHMEGFKIPFSLTIVDTPGHGDTQGIARDAEITEAIREFFKDENGIQELDAVGFVVQQGQARLTTLQKYIFNSIMSIFGKDIGENIVFMITHADNSIPPVLAAIQADDLPYVPDETGLPRHHRFNNAGFWCSNRKTNSPLFHAYWQFGMENFESFFVQLARLSSKSLTLTGSVLDERSCLNATIDGLLPKIQEILTKMEGLRKTNDQINLLERQINDDQRFEIQVQVWKNEKVAIPEGVVITNCRKCTSTCHYPCYLPLTMDKEKCAAMTGGVCNICQNKCHYSYHSHEKYRWEPKQVTETRTDEDLKQKLNTDKLDAETLRGVFLAELDAIEKDCLTIFVRVSHCIKRLDEIALRPQAFTTPDYIALMINKEETEAKPGYLERISSLQSLLKKAKMLDQWPRDIAMMSVSEFIDLIN